MEDRWAGLGLAWLMGLMHIRQSWYIGPNPNQAITDACSFFKCDDTDVTHFANAHFILDNYLFFGKMKSFVDDSIPQILFTKYIATQILRHTAPVLYLWVNEPQSLTLGLETENSPHYSFKIFNNWWNCIVDYQASNPLIKSLPRILK